MRKKLRQNMMQDVVPIVPAPVSSTISYSGSNISSDSKVMPSRERTFSSSTNNDNDDVDQDSCASSTDEEVTVATSAVNTASNLTSIAVFGAYSKMGTEFVRLAIDAGYRVQAMCLNIQQCNEFAEQPNMVRFVGQSLEDVETIAKTVQGTQYVVCLLNDTLNKKEVLTSGNIFYQFIRLLYPLLQRETSVQVLFWQAHSLSSDMYGSTPLMGKVVRTMARRRMPNHDKVIRYIAQQHKIIDMDNEDTNTTPTPATSSDTENGLKSSEVASDTTNPRFSFVVARPSIWQKEGASTRKLAASKSQPGPMPATYIDLAEFTLNALLNRRLYNSCPYVVADTF